MPLGKLKAARNALVGALDVNGDGVIDHRDAIVAAKIAGASAAGVGVTAFASASAGSAIIATGATAVAAKVTAVAGAVAGAFIASTVGTATATVSVLALGPSSLLLGSVTITSAVSAKVLAVSMSAGALMGQAANGVIAGMPVIQQIALSNAIAAKQVVLIAGVPMGVSAALAAGLIAIVIVGGYAYYLLTVDQIDSTDGIPTGTALA